MGAEEDLKKIRRAFERKEGRLAEIRLKEGYSFRYNPMWSDYEIIELDPEIAIRNIYGRVGEVEPHDDDVSRVEISFFDPGPDNRSPFIKIPLKLIDGYRFHRMKLK